MIGSLARSSTDTVATSSAKPVIRYTADDVETRLAAEARAMATAGGTQDVREGVEAFLAKRSPRFGTGG